MTSNNLLILNINVNLYLVIVEWGKRKTTLNYFQYLLNISGIKAMGNIKSRHQLNCNGFLGPIYCFSDHVHLQLPSTICTFWSINNAIIYFISFIISIRKKKLQKILRSRDTENQKTDTIFISFTYFSRILTRYEFVCTMPSLAQPSLQ